MYHLCRDAEGEPVLFQWVEWIREFFESRKEASSSTPSATQSHSADSDEEIAETAASDYQNRFRVGRIEDLLHGTRNPSRV